MRISELRMLDIVNVKDGRRLGPIKDLDLDLERGVVKAVVVSGLAAGKGWSLFGNSRSEDFFIPWERVKKIGVDVILVDVHGLPGFDFDSMPPL
ncbi:MAG: YlmC/YmxH family sporulation protein [Peptococcaceae bacterium]|nr:YlmC/YmxH family sporulation protein [Peptococcaceae bacterium]